MYISVHRNIFSPSLSILMLSSSVTLLTSFCEGVTETSTFLPSIRFVVFLTSRSYYSCVPVFHPLLCVTPDNSHPPTPSLS